MQATTINPLALTVGGCLALAAAMGIGRFIYTPILPFMAVALDLSKSEAGLIASANFLGYLIGALLAAGAFVRGDPHRWFLAALAASAVTTAAMAAAETLPAFSLLRFAGGLASAFVLVLASALILERLALAGKASYSGLHFAGVGIGIATSAVLVFLLGHEPGDWRTLWLAGGAFSLICLVGVFFLVPGSERVEPTAANNAPTADAAAEPMAPALKRLILAYGLFGFGYVITATFISTIVREIESIATLEPMVWLAVGLAGAPSVVLWNRIARFTGTAAAFALACLLEAVGVGLSVLTTGATALTLAAVLLGGTFMAITALGLVEARRLSPQAPRRAIGLMTAAFGFGQMVGPIIAGYGRDWTGSFAGPSFLAVLALVIAAALVGLRKAS